MLMEWSFPDLAGIILFIILIFLSEFRPYLKSKLHSRTPTVSQVTDVLPKKRTLKDIPGPRPLPIIGTRWIYYGMYKLNKLHEAHKDLFRRYGGIVKEEALWNFPVVNIMERGDVEKILRMSSRYPLRPPTEVTAHYRASRPDRYTSLGITNEQGERWHHLRSLLTPDIMSAKTMTVFFPELLSVTEDFNRLLATSRTSSGDLVSFDELACRMGLESVCCLVLGRRLGTLDHEASNISLRLGEAIKELFLAARDTYYGLPFWKLWPTPAYKRFMQAEDTIYDIISEIVESAEKLESDTSLTDTQSVFMSILKAPGLDIREKKATIIDFIAAGIKTLGNTLVFLLYLMAKNKECQQKLVEEIESLIPSGSDLTQQSLSKAQYLKACITETYRLLPTAPCLARILETETELSGYHLPPGSVILVHTWQACTREENFPEADKFVPERWMGRAPSPLVAPFGTGRRLCPGKRFVQLELQVLLAQILRRFEVEFEGELEVEFEFLLAPKSPTNFRLKDRH